MKPHGQPLNRATPPDGPLLCEVPEMRWSVHFQANRGPARQSDLPKVTQLVSFPGEAPFFVLSTKFLFFSYIKEEPCYLCGGFSSGSTVKNLHAMQETQETQFQSLSWEDPLEEGMAIQSSILS